MHAIAAAHVAGAQNGDDELTEVFGGLTAADWIAAGLILAVAIVVGRLLTSIVTRIIDRSGHNMAARLLGRFFGLLVVAGGIIYALGALGVRLVPLLGVLGIGGLALAIGAQSILENLLASVLLQLRRPFQFGDEIASGDFKGVVEDINFRVVVLRSFDDERLYVPCADVLGSTIVNVTARRLRRTRLVVGVAYSTDLERAQRVLLDAMTGVEGVFAEPAPQAWVSEFADSSIDFSCFFWHAPQNLAMLRVRSAVAMAIKASLDEAGITIAFPQRTLSFLDGHARVEVRQDDGREPGSPPSAR